MVTPAEVFKLITSMSAKSSPADFVPTSVIKACSNVISEIISNLANRSFAEGRFPKFKHAQVTPLLKKDGLDKDNPANYRHISNLNTQSKIIERLAFSRLRQHLIGSPNFNPAQFVFRRHHSTETSLLRTTNAAYRTMDREEATILVALDISAALKWLSIHSATTSQEHIRS